GGIATRRTVYVHVGSKRSTLVHLLEQAKIRFKFLERSETVVGNCLERIGTVRGHFAVVGAAMSVELEERLIEGAGIVWSSASATTIRNIRAGETAVVAAQVRVRVNKLTEPVRTGTLGKREVQAIIVTSCARLNFAGCATCDRLVIHAFTGVDDQEVLSVRANQSGIFNSMIETCTEVACLDRPVTVEL